MHVERAIFTSAETDAGSGYQLVARTSGVSAVDLRALSQWGPSHDSLCETRRGAASVNFHALPSGAYCISRTTTAGAEYSGRSGPRIDTQCLVVGAELLVRFGNNPFALLTAARAQGALAPFDGGESSLRPFSLAGRASAMNQLTMSRLVRDVGVDFVVAAIQAALDGRQTILVADCDRDLLVEGLINCVPVECRTALSFSTGLRISDRRPFRICAIARLGDELARARRRDDATILDSNAPESWPPVQSAWAALIRDALAGGRIAWLANQWRRSRPAASLATLPELAEMLRSSFREEPTAPPKRIAPTPGAAPQKANSASTPGRRADLPHARHSRSAVADSTAIDEAAQDEPSRQLGWQHPEVLERLELLDDTVFEAIAGKSEALDRLRTLWPETLAALGPELVEESRSQYIQHALRVWQDCAGDSEQRNPRLAVNAAEVVAMLLGD